MLKTASGRGYRLLGIVDGRQESTAADPVVALRRGRVPTTHFRPICRRPASDLIGRDAAVQQLRDLLSAYRVVTLTGPGGIGKTSTGAGGRPRLSPTLRG